MQLFELIQRLTKAEKRNFKLYALQNTNSTPKYLQLYDIVEIQSEYDEKIVLHKLPNTSKTQLASLKKHLYYSILESLSNLYSKSDPRATIHQQINSAQILLQKALPNQAQPLLTKAKKMALQYQFYTLALEVVDIEKKVALFNLNHSSNSHINELSKQSEVLTSKISNINALSNLAIQLSTLNLKLGYARSEKDKKFICNYFADRLNNFSSERFDFHENLYYFQCRTWFSLIQFDFVRSYRWGLKWYQLFEQYPLFKKIYFDYYIRATSRLLDIMFMTRQLGPMKRVIEKLESEMKECLPTDSRAMLTQELTILFARINISFLDSNFKQGLELVPRIETFIDATDSILDEHYQMLLYYKVACLYFGDENYKMCNKYLSLIINIKEPKFRRDLQVFARILHLISSYEMGDDSNLERQIISVYRFVVKINDMHSVQRAIITFLRRLPYVEVLNFKSELKVLYEELKPLETDPYKRRPFFYLDIISWIESKIEGLPIRVIRKNKYTPSR